MTAPLLVYGRDLWSGCRVRHPRTGWQWWRYDWWSMSAVAPDGRRLRVGRGLLVEVHGDDFDRHTRPNPTSQPVAKETR